MAAQVAPQQLTYVQPVGSSSFTEETSLLDNVHCLSSSPTIVSINPETKAPFHAIRHLFDYLRSNQDDAAALNATYPKRGIFKTAATHNATADQKFTIDLSPVRNDRIPGDLHARLAAAGLDDVLAFFQHVDNTLSGPILSSLSTLAGVNFSAAHKTGNVNYRLCDYYTDTADPESDNGCGAHTDYGTFSIIFQDGTPGLEMEEDAAATGPGVWVPVPGDATVILAGWCAVILSGGRIRATRHRVRRVPGVRRLSAVLFVAPDLNVQLKPVTGLVPVASFSKTIVDGQVDVDWFKSVMGKRWRHREGNEALPVGYGDGTQDSEIRELIWGQ